MKQDKYVQKKKRNKTNTKKKHPGHVADAKRPPRYMCMYVCMYVCMYIYIYTYTHTSYIADDICVCMYVCMYVCIYIYNIYHILLSFLI